MLHNAIKKSTDNSSYKKYIYDAQLFLVNKKRHVCIVFYFVALYVFMMVGCGLYFIWCYVMLCCLILLIAFIIIVCE